MINCGSCSHLCSPGRSQVSQLKCPAEGAADTRIMGFGGDFISANFWNLGWRKCWELVVIVKGGER